MHTSLSVPTMIWMFVGACIALALSVGTVARRADRDGLSIWAMGLVLNGGAYALVALRSAIPDLISIVVSNTLISSAYAFYLLAITTFLDRRIDRAFLALPPAITAVAFYFLIHDMQARIFLGQAILLMQGLLIGGCLIRHRFDFPTRGRTLMLIGIALAMGAKCWQICLFLTHGESPTVSFVSDIPLMAYCVSFFAIILITNGFILMAKERSDERLRSVAMKDRLTGCWNRIRIEEVAEQELARLKRYGHPVALLMIDIDHFKTVNDRHGHSMGDTVLRTFGELAHAAIRSTDIVGRWGGEEFVIILPSCGFQDAYPLAERLRTALQQNPFDDGLYVTASIGVALARSTDHWETWLTRADTALYAAKNDGRNRTIVEDMQIDQTQIPHDPVEVFQLQWRTIYETGNAEVDSEHREIFETANALMMLGRQPPSKTEILARIEPFLKIVRTHFAHEDRLLLAAQGQTQAVRDHLESHVYLSKRAEQLLQRYRNNEVEAAAIFHFIVFEYVTQHILIEDRKIASLLPPPRPQI